MSENGAFVASQNGSFIESQNGARGGGVGAPATGQLFMAVRAGEQVDVNPGGWPVPLLQFRESLIIQRYNAATGIWSENIYRRDAPLILADITVSPPERYDMRFNLLGLDRSEDEIGILFTEVEGVLTPGAPAGDGIETVYRFVRLNANTGGLIQDLELARTPFLVTLDPRPEWLRAGITEAGPVFTIAETGTGKALTFIGNTPGEPLLGTDTWFGGVTMTDRDGIGEPGVRYWLPQVNNTTLARNGTVGRPEFSAFLDEAVFTYKTYPAAPKVWGIYTPTATTSVIAYDHDGSIVRQVSALFGGGTDARRSAFQQTAQIECNSFHIQQDGASYEFIGLATNPGQGNTTTLWGPNAIDNQEGLINVDQPNNYYLVGEVFNDP